MLIDFSPVSEKTITVNELGKTLTVNQLRDATNASVDLLVDLIKQANDEAIVFTPNDPEADDPGAPEDERYMGWGLGHLIVHVTASAEEYAAISSILARGIPYAQEPRLRYETHWRSVTTQAQVLHRLEESRRIRLAYLSAYPDEPNLELIREMSEGYVKFFGELNSIGVYLMGLYHEWGHYAQIREALRQALESQQG